MQNLAAELEQEQAYVTMLYRRLDTLRERAQAELERALGYDGGGNVQARVDRDAFVARHSGRLAQLAAAEHGLCFGRLDRSDGSHLYIGRMGLLDDDREPLLVDWRAPAAQPFYRATNASRSTRAWKLPPLSAPRARSNSAWARSRRVSRRRYSIDT